MCVRERENGTLQYNSQSYRERDEGGDTHFSRHKFPFFSPLSLGDGGCGLRLWEVSLQTLLCRNYRLGQGTWVNESMKLTTIALVRAPG